MTAPSGDEKYREMRALAAELLRAHRVNDRTAFDEAMLKAEGQVPALLVSLCGLANRAMDKVMGRAEVTALVTQLAAEMDAPVRRDLYATETWADAISFLEAMARDDGAQASAIMCGQPDLLLFHGHVTQAMAEILVNVPEETRAAWIADLRAMPPRPLGPDSY